MKTVSIGIMRDDGDFAILATLNNNDERFEPELFDQLARGLRATMTRVLGEDIEILERQDAPDYVHIDDVDDNFCYHCGYEHDKPSRGMYPAEGCDDYDNESIEEK